jgi:hypothetical protein
MSGTFTPASIFGKPHRGPSTFGPTSCDQEANVGDLINLKKFKKRVERERSASEADSNRAKFGRTKAEKERQKAFEEHSTAFLDQHRRDDGDRS